MIRAVYLVSPSIYIWRNKVQLFLTVHYYTIANYCCRYCQGAKIGEDILIEAKTLRAGKKLAFLEVEITNKETGNLLVKATHTKYLLQNN